jgi:hypothetical protein
MSLRVIDPNSTQKKKEEESASTIQPLSVSQGGAATPISGGTQQQQQQVAPQQAPSSGSFTDLSKYKQAAQNAGNRIAEGVQSKFQTKNRQGESALKATSKQFTTAMDTSSGYAATEEGRAGAVSNVGQYTAGQAGYNQPTTTTTTTATPTTTPTTQTKRQQTTPWTESNKLKSQLGDKYDSFIKGYNDINSRMHTRDMMYNKDFGYSGSSSHLGALSDLYKQYGVSFDKNSYIDEVDSTPTTNPPSPVSNQPLQNNNFTETDFKDVINSQYTGVRSANEVDAYQQALARSQAIKDYAKLINDPNRSGDLLRSTFGQDQQYSEGMNKLDSYLYGKSGAASNIKASEQFKNAQNFDQRLEQTGTELSALAKARAEAIDKMRGDARQAFTDVATGRTQQIEDRLDDVRSEWDSLTNMLRDEFYEPGESQSGAGQQAYDDANNQYQNYTNEISDLEAKLKDPKWMSFPLPGGVGLLPSRKRKEAEARLAELKLLKQQAYDAMAGVTGTGRKLKTDGAELSPLAMALLGVGQNTQLFNSIKDEESLNNLIKSREYERDRLIGKGEQANLARLEALSKLANSPGMEYTNKYFDAKRAGTLTASDSLDRENVANKLNEAMAQFKTDANKDVTAQGYANDRYKRVGRKSGEIHRYASATGSLDDVLNKAGYNYQQNLADPNISNSDIAEMVNLYNQYDKKDPILGAMKSDWESLTDLGSWTGKDTLREGWYQGANLINDIGNKLGVIGDFTGLDALGNVLQDVGKLFGSDKGAKAANAEALAQQRANENLQAALTKQLQDSGFYNTIKAGDLNDQKIRSRQQALIDLLARLDSTNRGSY